MMYDDVGAPAQAWDFKTGAATLTTSRIAQMQSKSGLVGLRISMIKLFCVLRFGAASKSISDFDAAPKLRVLPCEIVQI